jgi:hypothetical protein
MKDMLDRLISIGSPALARAASLPKPWQGLKGELHDLLLKKNGFYAFESALLVRPLGESSSPLSLERWNERELWRNTYNLDLSDLYFFAEDIFGGQFALSKEGVVSFDPETAEIEKISADLEGWAKAVLDDFDYLTGHTLASSWQKEHGRLPTGRRLIPKRLFVLGGEFETSNLMSMEDVKGMRSRGGFATELKDVPNGSQIRFELDD